MSILLRRVPGQIALLLTLLGTRAGAQVASLGPSCNPASAGITDVPGFLAFDRELRTALAKQDSLTVAVLSRYLCV
ncbi:MAG: hypothetical protein WDO73_06210 [Ignavibacteriota bacterium]